MAILQFQLTDELVGYLSSAGRSVANDFRFALIGGSGAAWTFEETSKLEAYKWLGIDSEGVESLGNNVYQFAADSAVSGNILFAVSSEIAGGSAPELGSTAPNGAPSNSTTAPLYSLAVGETTFGPAYNDNADFSYENSFGLFLNLQAIDATGNTTGPLINGGALNAQKVYNYGYWGASVPGAGNVVALSSSTNLVPPLGASQADTSPENINVALVSNGAYHDFSSYLDYLSVLSGGSVNLDDGNYKAWINYNSSDQYNAYARFYGFENSDPEQDGYIILAGTIQGQEYSYFFPWSPQSLNVLEELDTPALADFNYLKNPNAIYGNNAGAIVKAGDFWISKQTVAEFFNGGTAVNTGSSGAFPSGYQADAFARAPGDLIFGLGYGILGSTSTAFNAAGIWNQVSLYDVSLASAPSNLGELPSQVWYAETGNSGATYDGPVAEGIWGGWAHPSYAAAEKNEYWNNYSYMLRGYVPSSYADYLDLNPSRFDIAPVLDPGIYAWAMDDRLGKASVDFTDSSGARFIIGKPWSEGPGSHPISGNPTPTPTPSPTPSPTPEPSNQASFKLLDDANQALDFGFVIADPALVISSASVLQVQGQERVTVSTPVGDKQVELPINVDELLDGYISYRVSGLAPGGSTVVSFQLPSGLAAAGINGNALVKFNYQTGQFQEYLDVDGTPLYQLRDANNDGVIDAIDITLRDGDPRWDGDGLVNGSVTDPVGYISGATEFEAVKLRGRAKKERQTVEGNLLANSIIGSKKKDLIIGGLGADVMDGRSGRDIYLWNDAAESGVLPGTRDVITEFRHGKRNRPKDQLDLRALGPGLTFIGADAFSAVAGQVRFDAGLLEVDLNGNGLSDFSVELQRRGDPLARLWASDLLL